MGFTRFNPNQKPHITLTFLARKVASSKEKKEVCHVKGGIQ